MGQITDSLRATLRELAQSDARLYRGLQEELGDTPLATSHPAGPPLRSALPVKAAKGGKASSKLAASGRSDGKASVLSCSTWSNASIGCCRLPHTPPEAAARPNRLQRSIFAIREQRISPPTLARSPSNPQPVLRPQDLVVLLRLALDQGPAPTYAALGAELGMTASEAHAAVERAVGAKLAIKGGDGKPSVVRAALKSFVQHGARYCFPASQGGLSRGVPTGYAASPLKEQIRQGNDPPPVWPSKKGTARGIAFYPLYPSVPEAAARNPALGELLALFDAVRGGSAREQALAVALLEKRLQP